MKVQGYASFQGEAVAIFTTADGQKSFFHRENEVAELMSKEGMDPAAKIVYSHALEGLQNAVSQKGIDGLQAIREVNDFVLPSGIKLGDTAAGNQPHDFSYDSRGDLEPSRIKLQFSFPGGLN